MRLGALAPGEPRGKQPIGTEIELTFPTVLGENNHGQARAVRGELVRAVLWCVPNCCRPRRIGSESEHPGSANPPAACEASRAAAERASRRG